MRRWARGGALLALALGTAAGAQTIGFSVRMAHPERHEYQVTMRVAGPTGELTDFMMPEWMPGYYGILHYANNVSHFTVTDGAGRPLGWERTTESTWRVVTAHAAAVEVRYDVAATRAFVATNFLDATRGFIAPPGLFLYLRGKLKLPATVTVHLPPGWTTAATGLEAVPGARDEFRAPDFDVLYDSPWLLGTQPTVSFTVRGVPHEIVLDQIPAGVGRAKMARDLQRIVTTATDMMGTVPYRKYVFLMIGHGNGGIEHLNSAAISFNGRSLLTLRGYASWLPYVAHEYFHNFNVKRIRPLALGPFDYEVPNLTRMLWVSEGLTVYYEDLLVERAGLMSRRQYLGTLQAELNEFENAPGHRYQSDTESSLDSWSTGSGEGANRAISVSYYDNGGLLGAMLDLAIREDSGNRHSLDSAMRYLYRTYAVRDQRGFTDAEFQQACEREAGAGLAQVFSYAATTAEPDYAKYFAYAGLQLTVRRTRAAGAYLGMSTQALPQAPGGGRGVFAPPPPPLVIRSVDAGSPAQAAGLEAGDVLTQLNGQPVTPLALNAALAAGAAGSTLTLRYERGGAAHTAAITLAAGRRLRYSLTAMAHPTPLAVAIYRAWLARAP